MAALHYWELGTADELLIGLVGPMTRGSTSALRALLSPHWDRSIELDLARCTGIDLNGALALTGPPQNMRWLLAVATSECVRPLSWSRSTCAPTTWNIYSPTLSPQRTSRRAKRLSRSSGPRTPL